MSAPDFNRDCGGLIDSSFCAVVNCISSCIFSAVAFQEVSSTISLIFTTVRLCSSGVVNNASSQALIKACGEAAIATTSPYISTTSLIGVLTIGSSAAMYSRVLVGLMKRVDSFSAKGSRQTFQPASKCGSAL